MGKPHVLQHRTSVHILITNFKFPESIPIENGSGLHEMDWLQGRVGREILGDATIHVHQGG